MRARVRQGWGVSARVFVVRAPALGSPLLPGLNLEPSQPLPGDGERLAEQASVEGSAGLERERRGEVLARTRGRKKVHRERVRRRQR